MPSFTGIPCEVGASWARNQLARQPCGRYQRRVVGGGGGGGGWPAGPLGRTGPFTCHPQTSLERLTLLPRYYHDRMARANIPCSLYCLNCGS